MKFSEAMKALEEGKKVRCVEWEKDKWIAHNAFDNYFIIINDDGAETIRYNDAPDLGWNFVDSWELFKEKNELSGISG